MVVYDIIKNKDKLNIIHGELVKTSQQTCPYILREYIYEQVAPEFSIVMPIHNQEQIIEKTMTSVIEKTKSIYEIIIILDACHDQTENIICQIFDHIQATNLKHVIIVKQDYPIFETACDNIGFKLSIGRYIIEIQADILILEDSYDQLLVRPVKKFTNVIGVSGRGCKWFNYRGGYGKLGPLIEYTLDQISNNMDGGRYYTIERNLGKNKFYSMETCMRGPLLLCHDKLKELNYLDEKNFFLNDSDNDLFARAYYQKKYICGYVPIDVISKLDDGSTRKPRDKINQESLNERHKRSDGGFYRQLSKIYNQKNPEILNLS